MPTDIALSTNTPTGSLELRQAQPLPSGGGYAMFLIVRSGGFAAAVPYFASVDAWRDFSRALGGVTVVDALPAKLHALEGDDMLAIGGAGDGLIAISGTLRDPDDDQLLRFRFVTSSEGLPAFISGVRQVEQA